MSKIKLIAHRGLVAGPDRSLENKPDNIRKTQALGYDSEVDLWVIDHRLWLGHDEPQYSIDREFLYSQNLWIHAKNMEALKWLRSHNDLVYFWHENDTCTLTSNGYIWTYPERPLTPWSIRLMPEWQDPQLTTIADQSCWAICTDWVLRAQEILDQAQEPKSL